MRVDGKSIQNEIKKDLKEKVATLKKAPTLAVIYAGENPAIAQYVERKRQFGLEIGMNVEIFSLPAKASHKAIADVVQKCGRDEKFSAMIVQLPLPVDIEADKILDLIPTNKDVDMLSSAAYRIFEKGEIAILPPTVGAIKEILKRNSISISDKNVVVIGQGRLVGLPVTAWLKRGGLHPATITKETKNINGITSQADIIITGVGVPHILTPDMVKDGVVLIDAGTSEANGKIVGDIDPRCEEKAALFTPVPGGVGPITVAMLFTNVVALTERS